MARCLDFFVSTDTANNAWMAQGFASSIWSEVGAINLCLSFGSDLGTVES